MLRNYFDSRLLVACKLFPIRPEWHRWGLPGSRIHFFDFIFFAYQGFGRIATIDGEVRNPSSTITLSIMLALIASAIVYILAGFVATGLQDYKTLSGSGSPIANAAMVTGNSALVATVSLGALIATARGPEQCPDSTILELGMDDQSSDKAGCFQ